MRFNGSDYGPEHDDKRLGKQHERIRNFMLAGGWWSFAEIAQWTGDPQASVSAQLRHLRKPRFGSYVVEKRSSGERKDGLFEYRLTERDQFEDPPADPPKPKMVCYVPAGAVMESVARLNRQINRLSIYDSQRDRFRMAIHELTKLMEQKEFVTIPAKSR